MKILKKKNVIQISSFKDEISEAGSAPKTPQDVTSISSMPLTVQMSILETPPSGPSVEEMVDHPLSPTQEQASDIIVRISQTVQIDCVSKLIAFNFSIQNYLLVWIVYHRKRRL